MLLKVNTTGIACYNSMLILHGIAILNSILYYATGSCYCNTRVLECIHVYRERWFEEVVLCFTGF